MDRHQYLITEYQLILGLSEQMLVIAREERWDELVEQEVSYAKMVEATARLPLSADMSVRVQETIRLTLRGVLENESEIKRLLQTRLDKLIELMGHSSRSREINTTYGLFADHSLMQGEPQ